MAQHECSIFNEKWLFSIFSTVRNKFHISRQALKSIYTDPKKLLKLDTQHPVPQP